MALRRCTVISKVWALLLCWGALSPVGAQTPSNGLLFEDVVRTLPSQASADAGGAALIRATAAELLERSATFAELVESLYRFDELRLTLRPASLPGLLGRGRYSAAGRLTIAAIEINPFRANPYLRVRALAHELAHAFEIACVQRAAPGGLREKLAARAERRTQPGDGIETPFARMVENAVVNEWRRPGLSQFSTLADRYGLDRCENDGAAMPIATARN